MNVATYDRAVYAYNALHWRVLKKADTNPAVNTALDQQRLMYYTANWQLLEERVDDGSSFPTSLASALSATNHHVQYIWGLRYIDDLAVRRVDLDKDGDYGDTNDKTYYHCTDAQFSTIAVIADTKQLLERVSYDAYGRARHAKPADVTGDGVVDVDDQLTVTNSWGAAPGGGDSDRDGDVDSTDLLAVTNNWGAGLASGELSSTGNTIGWDGYVFNPELAAMDGGLYTVRFRYYLVGSGRWTTRDPAGYVDGSDVYQYVSGLPLTYSDPMGLMGTNPLSIMAAYAKSCAPNQCCSKCKANVSISFNSDWKTSAASLWAKSQSGPHISIDPNNPNWEAAMKEALDELGDCCVDSIVITAHGAGGQFGSGNAKVNSDVLADPDSGAHKLFQALAGKKCQDSTSDITLKACNQASGEEGMAFMEDLARLMHMPVVGWTDWYAVVPHGKKYRVFPDGTVVLICDEGAYKGSFWYYMNSGLTKAAAGANDDKQFKGRVKADINREKDAKAQRCQQRCTSGTLP